MIKLSKNGFLNFLWTRLELEGIIDEIPIWLITNSVRAMWWKEYQIGSHSFGVSTFAFARTSGNEGVLQEYLWEKRTKELFANPVIGVFWTSKERNTFLELEDDLKSKSTVLPPLTCHSLVRQSLANLTPVLLLSSSFYLWCWIPFSFCWVMSSVLWTWMISQPQQLMVSCDHCHIVVSDT